MPLLPFRIDPCNYSIMRDGLRQQQNSSIMRVMSIPSSMMCRCTRCRHEWVKRIAGRPKRCPKCKEVNWDIPAGKLKRGRPPAAKGKKAA